MERGIESYPHNIEISSKSRTSLAYMIVGLFWLVLHFCRIFPFFSLLAFMDLFILCACLQDQLDKFSLSYTFILYSKTSIE